MIDIKRPVNIHNDYHAHVYFDSNTLEFATNLCERIGTKFGLKIGRIHQKPVGPHPEWSCQIIFARQDFEELIPWMDENRDGLTVLVHGLTGEHLKDHTDHAYWLGNGAILDLSMFDDL
jgi:DOPA 4,5-dioxygenase